ncbi:uncharacterized protein LOC120693101 [Panicum virgatum]|uniref:Outer arm dynein light chain 1 protein n=1 Tax=Panicum virgatum TaxID=38727 RepID=A0A8T0MQJ3_PANVG|nr:uncharacterized protein LOC120693101 [Panicum virgatum]XP_039832439.1 uncharacterized protein LOC120693101 [Panicum virgatum]KAG2538382.1 hypothetical protein PVAP13_9NG357300 [Panicum virgatum]
MTKMSCFPTLLAAGRKKKNHKVAAAKEVSGNERPKVNPVEFIDAPVGPGAGEFENKVAPRDVKFAAAAAAMVPVASHEGGGQFVAAKASAKGADLLDFEFDFHLNPTEPNKPDGDGDGAEKRATDTAANAARAAPADPSPKLKRSCSNIETKRPGPREAPEMPARSRSYGDLGNLIGGLALDTSATPQGAPEASPASVKTSHTADCVMLKKRSSSQVLPSRSRKLWWRLFLWSHRNLHRPGSARPAEACSPARHGGYTSDTLEEGPAADRKNKKVMVDDSPSPPPFASNQWVAFCAENSLHDRVSAWVCSIENEPPFHIAEEDEDYDGGDNMDDDECAARPRRPVELGESSSGKNHGKSKRCAAADEVVQANTIVQSLNAFSSVAHISGMGLKVMPMIAPFSSLRAVNLSSNFIVHISPGSLPKGLHSLDLSRNKIANIEGLRELTKLRVLNLSYNRISRIGHGLSNCTAIRELYLAGNKISDVEGLHRLLKLAVLDLSFNKITTAKALGQLVANYHSLLALNLVGNPVQANVGDDALRRAVTGLLPNLAYLNKQPVKPQRSAREVATDSVARAALGGSGSRNQGKRASRRLTQSPRSSSLTRGRSGGGDGSVRSRSKGRHHG